MQVKFYFDIFCENLTELWPAFDLGLSNFVFVFISNFLRSNSSKGKTIEFKFEFQGQPQDFY